MGRNMVAGRDAYTHATRHARQIRGALIPACSNIQNLYPAPGKKHNGQGMAQHVLGPRFELKGMSTRQEPLRTYAT